MSSGQLIIHSLFLGFCAAVLSSIISFSPASVFSFYSTSFAYMLLRRRLVYKPSFFFYLLLVTLFAFAIGAFFNLSTSQKETACITTLLTGLYAIPNKYGLRRSIILKPLIIGFTWALITIGIAANTSLLSLPNDHSVFILFIEIALLTFLLSMLYDLRDFVSQIPGERTLVSVVGLHRFQQLFMLFTSASIAFVIWVNKSAGALPFVLSGLFCFYLLYATQKKRYLLTTWMIDSTFLLYYIVVFLCAEYNI